MIANRIVVIAASMLVAPLALAQSGGGGGSGGGGASGGASGSTGGAAAGAGASPGGTASPATGSRTGPAARQRSTPNLLDDQMGLPRDMETLRSGPSRVPSIMDDQTGMPRGLSPRRDSTQGSSATGAGSGTPVGSGSSEDDPLDGQSRIPPEDRFRLPTAEDCSRGWSSGLRWTEGEFEALCKR